MFTVSWLPGEQATLAIGGLDSTVYVWQYIDKSTLATYATPAGKIFHVAWSPNGKYLAVAMDQGYIQVVNSASSQAVFSQQLPNSPRVNCVAWSPDGNSLVSGDGDGNIRVWDVFNNVQTFAFPKYDGYINAVAWSHAGDRVAVGGGGKGYYTVQVWSVGGQNLSATFNGHSDDILALAWEPGQGGQSDQRVASASGDGTVQIWDSSSGSWNLTYRGHSGFEVVAMDWSPDGTLIASGGTDTSVQIWEAASGALQRVYRHANEVEGVAWSPDSTKVASASDDGTVQVWPGR